MKNEAIEQLINETVTSKGRRIRLAKMYNLLNKNKNRPFTVDGEPVYSITRRELADLLGLDWDSTAGSAARILTDDIKMLGAINLIKRVHSENQILYMILELET